MKTGERITVAGVRCTMPCRVLSIEEPASLPDLTAIAGAPSIVAVRAILRELEVSRVALLAYDVDDDATGSTFVALESAGTWRTITGDPLTITAREAQP